MIRQVRRQAPGCQVEVLTPDFQGQEMPLAKVIAERPDVFNHNVEVVPRLYPLARRGSEFARSCRVLRIAGELGEDEVVTKSGLMVGLGETHEEMVETFGALRESGVQVLTVGQYLRPSERHLPVVRYWHPDEFAALERAAYELGFDHVAAGPLVRSSYHADEHVALTGAGGRPRALAPGSRPAPGDAEGARTVPAQGQHPARAVPARDDRLIAINVIAYLLEIRHGGSFFGGPSDNVTVRYGAIPYEFTHPGDHCALVSIPAGEGASAVACQGQPGGGAAAPARSRPPG